MGEESPAIVNSDPYASLATLGVLGASGNVRVEWNGQAADPDAVATQALEITPKQAPFYQYRAIAIAILTVLLVVGIALAFALLSVLSAPISIPVVIGGVVAWLGGILAYDDLCERDLYRALDDCVSTFETTPADQINDAQRSSIAHLKYRGYASKAFRAFLNQRLAAYHEDVRRETKIVRLNTWFSHDHVFSEHTDWAHDMIDFLHQEGKVDDLNLDTVLTAAYGDSENAKAKCARVRPTLQALIDKKCGRAAAIQVQPKPSLDQRGDASLRGLHMNATSTRRGCHSSGTSMHPPQSMRAAT